jgi:hypothetical protein
MAARSDQRKVTRNRRGLIEPVACTPASGWEKGQVENQVGTLRDQFFRPKPRVKSLPELNAWLEDRCIAYARRTTIWEVYQDERIGLAGPSTALSRRRCGPAPPA